MRLLTKTSLFAASSILAIAGVGAGPAMAQDSDSASEVDDVIVVQGIRSSLQRSADIKRSADTVVDAISATDLGRFPDTNIAESLQRVTGVQINRVRGEGSTVAIRGLPTEFTQVTLNGNLVTSAVDAGQGLVVFGGDPGRFFDFTILPSEFIDTVEVFKGATADLEEGGLAGTVNVKTVRPLDLGERRIALSGQGVYEGNSGDVTPRVSGIFSDTFVDGKVGLTVAGGYQVREPETHLAFALNGLQATGGADFPGTNDFGRVVNRTDHDIFRERRERLNFLSTIQWQPSDTVEIIIDGLYSQIDIESERAELFHLNFSGASGAVSVGEFETIDDNVLGAGTQVATVINTIATDTRGASRVDDVFGELVNLQGEINWSDGPWRASIAGSFSQSDQRFSNLALVPRQLLDTVQTVDNEIPGVGYSAASEAVRFDPRTTTILSVNGINGSRFSDDLFDIQANAARDFELDGLSLEVEAGIKFTSREETGNFPFIVVPSAALATLGVFPAADPTFAPQAGPGAISLGTDFSQIIAPGNGDFLGAAPVNVLTPGSWLAANTPAFLSQFPVSQLATLSGVSTFDLAEPIIVEEDVFAGYIQSRFESDSGRVRGNIGLRIVHTDQSSAGSAPDLSQIVVLPDAGGSTVVPPAADIVVNRGYTEFLPSANLVINVTDDFLVRFGASRTLTRPALSALSPSASVFGGAGLGAPGTINQSNPFLNPFIANNFDASFEYYFGDSGALTMGLFFKELVSLVATDQQETTIEIIQEFADGSQSPTDQPFLVNSLTNGSGAVLKGVELGYQQAFTSLPAPFDGLGFQGNYTFIDIDEAESVTPLTQVSKHNFNLTGYYEKGPIGLRASYTYRGEFLSDPFGPAGNAIINESFGILDANLTVEVTDGVSLVVEAVNLLDQGISFVDGNGYPNAFQDFGRRVLFGARASF